MKTNIAYMHRAMTTCPPLHERQQRDADAARLRTQGLSYGAIAEALNFYSAAGAAGAIRRYRQQSRSQ